MENRRRQVPHAGTELSFQVTQPLALVSGGDKKQLLVELVPMLLSQIIGGMNIERTQAVVDQVAAELRGGLTKVSDVLGIRVSSASVPSIRPTPEPATGSAAWRVQPSVSPCQDALAELMLQRVHGMLLRAQRRRPRARHGE
jgi:hypothetical protein